MNHNKRLHHNEDSVSNENGRRATVFFLHGMAIILVLMCATASVPGKGYNYNERHMI